MAIYLKNSELTKQLLISKERDELTLEAIEMFQLMIKRCVQPMRYKDPMDREDCMAEAMSDVFKYWRSFDPNHEKANAFSYFTQTIKKGLAKGFRKLHSTKSINFVSINDETGIFNI